MRGGQPYKVFGSFCSSRFSPHARGQPCCSSISSAMRRFPPHARGSTRQLRTKAIADAIFPACARVNPPNNRHSFSIGNSPCMRGGQPARIVLMTLEAQFSPHVRGSTHETDTVNSDGMIHPACAGVTLSREWLYEPVYSPRMRGGQPFLSIGLSMVLVFTPHARGSTLPQIAYYVATRIHPACAGINPDDSGSIQNQKDSPRTRGGQPHVQVQWLYDDAFTPHARGSTL